MPKGNGQIALFVESFHIVFPVVKKGEYQCALLPLIKDDDDAFIRLKISTKPGYNWKVNYIIMNAIKGY